ncbi:hypothetical protein O0I10_006295 [Lichtheimia ornata]|uniref:Uncharacterized protein n=1 Tax=Lichtheimia ornata TaxID=688661 RepID=A0AAD7XUY8_9FUNG|nr:uncharacterized protein O0I10_006295 [Lichtheimia ornata]KAJ8658024.1 hypothetical protein O0I10_006295 [Lichtheimia ornata]
MSPPCMIASFFTQSLFIIAQINDPSTPSIEPINSHHQQRQAVIATATEEINQLTCQFMAKLNERSTAMANGGNFDRALRDVAVMQAIDPTSFLGYLKAGDIYQQQGRQQDAAAMYEKGLVHVSSSDYRYTNLQMRQKDALDAANKRVDFISQLPLELVVSEILPWVINYLYRLAVDTPCPYLYVSRTWRQRILLCNNLSFHADGVTNSDVFQFRELERFAEHVKTLLVEAGRSNLHEGPLSVFDDCDFPNLTHVTICYNGYEEDDLMSALESVRRTMTHLVLYMEGHTEEDNDDDYGTSRIHLGGVLDLCPGLVSLELMSFTIHHLTVQHTTLTQLTLSTVIFPLSYDAMINILSHLPSLVYFDLHHVPDLRFLTRLHVYCPGMKLLKCGGCDSFDEDIYDRHVQGLQKLRLGIDDVDEQFNADDLVPLLLENRQSIDHIRVTGRLIGESVVRDYKSLGSSLTFDRLKKLEVHAANDQLATLALSIIHRSPNLCHVRLGSHAANRDTIWNALRGLSNFQTLSTRKMTMDSISFRNILEHQVELGKDSLLKELQVGMGADVSTFSWMDMIGGLQNVTKVALLTTTIETPSAYLSTNATIAEGCPSLLRLELYFGRQPAPEGTITLMKDHPTLQCLRIHASSIAERDVVNLLSFTKLNNVIIIIAPIQDYLIALLRARIPHMKYIPY